MKRLEKLYPILAALISFSSVFAQEKPKDDKRPEVKFEEKIVEKKELIKIGGKDLHYTATTGNILIKTGEGTTGSSPLNRGQVKY